MKRSRHDGPTVQRPGGHWGRWVARLKDSLEEAGETTAAASAPEVRSSTVQHPTAGTQPSLASIAGFLGGAVKLAVGILAVVAGGYFILNVDTYGPAVKNWVSESGLAVEGQVLDSSQDPTPAAVTDDSAPAEDPTVLAKREINAKVLAWADYARQHCRRREGEVAPEVWDAIAKLRPGPIRITSLRARAGVHPDLIPYAQEVQGTYLCTNGQSYRWRGAARTRNIPDFHPISDSPIQEEPDS